MIEHFNPFALNGKTILVTGASSGIGQCVAIECAKLGAKLVIVGRNRERLNHTSASLAGEGHLSIELDLNVYESVSNIIPQLPKLDGIVYCAGIQKSNPAKLISRADLDEIFNSNLFSTINLNKEILTCKKLNKSASIVFISSTAAGIVAEFGNGAYSATKGAITSFSKVLALELSFLKTRVNCVSPGMVHTPLLDTISVDKEQLIEDEKRYPLGYGMPTDVAYAVIYLLSDAAKWLTGTNIVLDGGLTLR
ncbi:MAG: SDR family NAD(P)-dependent oxidoreductase [Bacteroidales bacterium]|nr:SDR family NAD(P)-dependent oxidoreductase [Bacteroidales bacterium]